MTFIVNDDPFLAKEVDADGVHLGQDDILKVSVKEARAMLGPGKIIGLSTESCYQAEVANKEDVDYIGYGPVFHTAVKDNCVGTKDVGRALEISRRPVVFIGGITLSNVDELLKKGAKNISVIRAITEADDITLATRDFRSKLDDARKGLIKSGKIT